jgi:glucosyl-dolichyl phosphate glucuronosyltransferase
VSIKPNWIKNLVNSFEKDHSIAICGGKIELLYPRKPRFYHRSIFIKSQYGYLNISKKQVYTHKVNGGNMAVHKKRLKNEARISLELGRKQGKLFGGEDSDICNRAIKKNLKVLFVPNAIIIHKIQKDRMRFLYLLKSFFYQGKNRAISKMSFDPTNKNSYSSSDFLTILLFLIPYLLGYLSYVFKNGNDIHKNTK